MKLKKILASLTAAALAVTTMAFAPVSVSAAEGTNLYSGPLVITTAYEGTNIPAFENAKAGDVIMIDVEGVGSQSYHQLFLQDRNNGFSTLTTINIAGAGSYGFYLDASMAASLKTADGDGNAWWLSGYDCTVSSVDYLPIGSTENFYNEQLEITTAYEGIKIPAYENAKAGDVIALSISAVGSQGYHQIFIQDVNNGYSTFITLAVSGAEPILFKLDENMANALKAADGDGNAWWLSGYDCTLTSIDYLKVGSALTEITPVVTIKDNAEEWKFSSDCAEEQIIAEMLDNTELDIIEGLSLVPGDDYTLTGEIVDGVFTATFALTEEGEQSYTISDSDSTKLTASCKIVPTYGVGVSVNNEDFGTADADKTEAAEGETVRLTATPKTGYKFVEWQGTHPTITNNTFIMPAQDVSVCAMFAEKKADEFDIVVSESNNGNVTVKDGLTAAKAGDVIELIVTPDEGYMLDSITVNDKAITGTSFEMPAEDVTVEVTFKKVGSADIEIEAPEGVTVEFEGSKDDVLKAIFGDDYQSLIDEGYTLDVVMTVKDESAVSDDDKALINSALADGQYVGLIIEVSLSKTKNGVSETVSEASGYVTFTISVPDSIIAEDRYYSVIRVHDGEAQNIGGTFNSADKSITVSSAKFSAYAIVYEDAEEIEEVVEKPAAVKYSISADKNASISTNSAEAGTLVNVKVEFGYDAYVICNGQRIAKITESGSFIMPSGTVSVVCAENGFFSMIQKAAPNSYIYVYDSDMNYIKTNGSVRGITGDGKVTVKLGEEYAGKTVTLYKGRKSTSVKLDSKTLNDNGYATFTVEGGKNYTAVVE